MRTTCLAYALDRWRKEGGYLEIRRSTHWPVPHVLHVSHDRRTRSHFVPPDELRRPWHALLGFDGVVLTEDRDPAEPMSVGGVVAGAALLLALSIGWAVRTKWREWRRRP